MPVEGGRRKKQAALFSFLSSRSGSLLRERLLLPYSLRRKRKGRLSSFSSRREGDELSYSCSMW